MFRIIDLLNKERKTLDTAGRQSFNTSKEIPSGPLDLVENCLKAQFKLSKVILENLKRGRFKSVGGFIGWGEGRCFEWTESSYCVHFGRIEVLRWLLGW